MTFDFIRFLGINDINELPDYEKLNNVESISIALSSGNEIEKNKRNLFGDAIDGEGNN